MLRKEGLGDLSEGMCLRAYSKRRVFKSVHSLDFEHLCMSLTTTGYLKVSSWCLANNRFAELSLGGEK
jgi:hypothetical protein